MTEEKKSKVFVYFFVLVAIIAIVLFLLSTFRNDIKEKVDETDNYITKFQYVATLNDNMINYSLEVIDGENLNGELYSLDGEWLSDLVDGKAIINEIDYNKYDKFKIKVANEVYEIEKK
ncbi:MAG: hypothetical protein J6X02_00145 [Bacilli bacterium]|nr:hypothetical protein [Bacilli bacterium]